MEREKTLCFSGHRYISIKKQAPLYRRLVEEIAAKADTGYRNFLCGGALGFDTLAAQAVLEVRTNIRINLVLVQPYMQQAQRWSARDRAVYEQIKANSDVVICLSEEYYEGCLLARNRYMVDKSSLLIAYCGAASGGTIYTVNYAEKNDVDWVNIY